MPLYKIYVLSLKDIIYLIRYFYSIIFYENQKYFYTV